MLSAESWAYATITKSRGFLLFSKVLSVVGRVYYVVSVTLLGYVAALRICTAASKMLFSFFTHHRFIIVNATFI